MFGLGLMEILLILVIILVLFGAGKLPKVMGELGKGIATFKDSVKGDKSEKSKKNKAKNDSDAKDK